MQNVFGPCATMTRAASRLFKWRRPAPLARRASGARTLRMTTGHSVRLQEQSSRIPELSYVDRLGRHAAALPGYRTGLSG